MSGAKYCGCDPGVDHVCDGCVIKALREVITLQSRVIALHDKRWAALKKLEVDISGREITGP